MFSDMMSLSWVSASLTRSRPGPGDLGGMLHRAVAAERRDPLIERQPAIEGLGESIRTPHGRLATAWRERRDGQAGCRAFETAPERRGTASLSGGREQKLGFLALSRP